MSTSDAVTESQTERVRQRAHELWEQQGRPEGLQGEHWARACRELQMEEKSGTDNTANRAKAGIDDAGSNVKDVANTFGQKADEAVQYASQTYRGAKDVAQQHIGDLERQIRGKPVQSALIAFGVGFVVGTLLTR
jgi:ElaB/YqjD/DUF883 family membrane-anchored ribosome-binding protein